MNTVLLAPGLELPVSGMPYGETPVLEIENRHRHLLRRVFVRSGILILLVIAAGALIWQIGQPLWGNWPQVDATVTSQYQYVSRGTHCSLGLNYSVDGQRLQTHYSEFDPCSQSRASGSVVRLMVDPANHGQVSVVGGVDPVIAELFVACAGSFPPLLWMSIFVYFTRWHYRAIVRLGRGPWREVTGTVVASSILKNRLRVVIRAADGPVFRVNFGLRGITYFSVPGAGRTMTLRLAGDGSGRVMVGVKGLDGDNLGVIGPAG